MAPDAGSSHAFQKLKIDTTAPHKHVPSSFASIPRRDSQRDGALSSHLEGEELAVGSSPVHINGSNRTHSDDHANGHYFDHGSYDDATAAVDGDGDDIETMFRNRKTSISFDEEVTLDSGNRLSLEGPLPKPASKDSSDTSNGEDYSDEGYVETPLDRRRRLQHRVGESRYPLLQTTVDELAVDTEFNEENDHVASLTSGTTASPPLEGARTPLEPTADYLLSPVAAAVSSPIEFPPFGTRKYGSMRSRSYRAELADGDSSSRRPSRRSSARSGRSLSSMSPAASFLARVNATDVPLKATEPDNEGQGIGYAGEYIIGKQIGFGGFSVVKEVATIEDGKRVVHAVKIVRKIQRGKSELENDQIQTHFDHEVEIWRYLRHPYILPLMRVYNTDFATFCITRLNKGGTLFDVVRDAHRKQKRGIKLQHAKRYTYQLASAMRYLHNDIMIVHRDIKLENCLVDMTVPNAEQDGGDVLLCDFGMADFITSDNREGPEPHSIGTNQNIGPADTSTSVAGSLQYAAPELFGATESMFSPAADIWALGVVVYALLTAKLPFNEGLDAKTLVKIQNGDWDVDILREADALQEGGFEEVLKLLRGCLNLSPSRRWTVNDVLSCAWLRGCAEQYENVTKSWLANS